jgi:hypothetical protein
LGADLEDDYHSAIKSDDNQKARAVATELTTRIARELSRLSINAPNWYALVPSMPDDIFMDHVSRDVLYSTEIARRMLWTDRDLPLKDFTTITNA